VRQVRGLLAKAEQFLARQRLDYAYQELYKQIRRVSKTQIEFNLRMSHARKKYLDELAKL
jgi:hypothetical protein